MISSANRSRTLPACLWAMLIAPFLPWYTFPLPFVVFVVGGLVTLPAGLIVGSPQPASSFVAYGVASAAGLFWIITGFLAFFSARRSEWRRALWFVLTNLACLMTILGIFLIASGFGPVEPLGYLTPIAFLGLAALPAAYEVAGSWLKEVGSRSGPDTRRRARRRLLVLVTGYGVAFAASLGMVALSVEAAIQRLPAFHFYWDEMAIRESAASTFAILGVASLLAFLTLSRLLLGGRTTGPPSS